MRIFLSYSSKDRDIAESIHAALEAAGHDVFFDRDSLPAGESFDVRILEALDQSNLLIFLLSPSSIEAGAYTLTEMGFARRRWRNPTGKVLPVVIREFDLHELPVYLRNVTVLEPEGNVPAEVVAAVYKLEHRGWRRARWAIFILAAIVGVAAIGYFTMRSYECRLVTTDAIAHVNRMIDAANVANQRERDLSEDISSVEQDSFMAFTERGKQRARDPASFDFKKHTDITWRLGLKRKKLDERLASVVRESNALMTKLAQQS